MLTRLLDSIADSFHHRFGWPSRGGTKPDEYHERHDETRGASQRHLDSRGVEGHYWGNPDGERESDRNRHR
jgi:hypothetical protein